MKKVTKAVIPVAGLGTRMLPATKAIPKEMLTLVDKPLIQYVVEEAAAAGIKEIVLVTHASKNSIENHFDTSFELEAQLESRVKRSLLQEVKSINPKGITMISVRQAEAKGLGHAILCARSVIGDEPFAVILPDVIIDKYHSDLGVENLAQMVNNYNEHGINQIMVNPVEMAQVQSYGVVDLDNQTLCAGETAKIIGMVEKPPREEAPSNLAITGRYVLSESIWSILAKTPPGAGDEIQLTDALYTLLDQQGLEAYQLVGKTHDCGNKLGFIKANIEYAIQRSEFKGELTDYIATVLAENTH